MAGGREIKTKIKSVQNTRKVTRALEMVSASKIRKAQEQMRASRPYVTMMRQVIGHIAHAKTEYQHPFLVERPAKRVGYVVISTDRGLCGGLNSNEFKALLADMRKWQEQGCEIDVVCIGNKALAFLKRIKVNIVGSVTHLGDKPQITKIIGVVKLMLDAYSEGKVDRLMLSYNDFINTMSQKVRIDTLLPLPADQQMASKHSWDYLYEPNAQAVLDDVLQRYVEALVFQGVLENLASEHAARMVAMKSASDNAADLISQLTLIYNKARQAAITQEISEIVGGAAAV
jgi:F-type H+-transporting ATPase subunit gamma